MGRTLNTPKRPLPMNNKDVSRMVVTSSGKNFCEAILRAEIQERSYNPANSGQKKLQSNTRYLTPENTENTIQEYLRTVPQNTSNPGPLQNQPNNIFPKAMHVNNRFFLPKLDQKSVKGLTKSQGNFVNRKLYESHKIVSDYAKVTESGSYQDLFRFVKPNVVTSKYSRNT